MAIENPEIDLSAEIAAEAAEAAPDVTEHVRDDAPVAESESGDAVLDTGLSGAPVDSAGTVFDPAVHVAGPDGAPVLTKTGRFRRRPGRKPGATSRASVEGSSLGGPVVAGGTSESAPDDSQTLSAARATVGLVEMIAVTLGGEDFAYRTDPAIGLDERKQGEIAFFNYYKARGMTDIPPGVALAVWGVMYAAPRMAAPRVRSRLSLFGAWIKNKFSGFKGRKNAAHADNGDNDKRKNNVGKAAQ